MRKLLVLAMLLLAGLTVTGTAGAVTDSGRTFRVTLLPSGDPDGSGTATVTVNPGTETVCYDIQVAGIDQPQEPAPGVGSAHIHVRPSGGIVVDLETQFVAGSTPGTFEASGCVTADRDLLVDILRDPEQYYLNIHTVAHPGGAVQGDLG